MPVPTSFDDLSATASSNSPQGSEPVGTQANEYIQAAFAFIKQLHDGFTPLGTLTAPTGTRLVLQQPAAPAGWTVDATSAFTDAAMRFNQSVTSGGTNAFSAINSGTVSFTTGGTALTTAQMPAHNHGVTDPGHAHANQISDPGHAHGISDPGHAHSGPPGGNFWSTAPGGSSLTFSSGSTTMYQAGGTGSSGTGIGIQGAVTNISMNILSNATGISTQNNGSGQAHTHAFAPNLNMKYADCIVAVKS
ncbi:hypothetical protein G3N59_10670 [Paraburkholderia sp. Ac-20340]|uniref:hypothetical protein n=1 Tax=Paraburkholderia sp. Ac-20340 TaxID=2703888 RepID=UPI00197EB8B7|nr:hypothetical protein [Paraburkholderia sp. Ac-20340]MBN3853842.1 hypothetical protein [Paraburkholderia sp. Ac-20340]